MAHAAATLPQAIVPPPSSSYLEKYQSEPDILGGEYTAYMDQYAAGNGMAPEELTAKVQTSTNAIPKVFLGCFTIDGKIRIAAVHHPVAYASIPGIPSQWDDRLFAFSQDLDIGHYIEIVEFPLDGFDETQAHPESTYYWLQMQPLT